MTDMPEFEKTADIVNPWVYVMVVEWKFLLIEFFCLTDYPYVHPVLWPVL